MVLSAMGPQTSVKALAAILQGDTKVVMRTEDIPHWYDHLGKHPDGYTIHRQRFDHNTWHVLAVAKQDGLLVRLSEQSLWAELRNPRFTTPILRSWMPWLMKSLLDSDHLRRLKCFGCESAILTAGNLDLDDAVMRGLKTGKLRIGN
jgi:hypothetical protein